MNIKGSVALVTGANRGVGRELVSALVEAGAAKVYAAARAQSFLIVDHLSDCLPVRSAYSRRTTQGRNG